MKFNYFKVIDFLYWIENEQNVNEIPVKNLPVNFIEQQCAISRRKISKKPKNKRG